MLGTVKSNITALEIFTLVILHFGNKIRVSPCASGSGLGRRFRSLWKKVRTLDQGGMGIQGRDPTEWGAPNLKALPEKTLHLGGVEAKVPIVLLARLCFEAYTMRTSKVFPSVYIYTMASLVVVEFLLGHRHQTKLCEMSTQLS